MSRFYFLWRLIEASQLLHSWVRVHITQVRNWPLPETSRATGLGIPGQCPAGRNLPVKCLHPAGSRSWLASRGTFRGPRELDGTPVSMPGHDTGSPVPGVRWVRGTDQILAIGTGHFRPLGRCRSLSEANVPAGRYRPGPNPVCCAAWVGPTRIS